MRQFRVVIADDSPEVRAALAEHLTVDPRFEVVGEAATGSELQRQVRDRDPDVVLLDVRMPAGGEEAARAITAHRRGTGRARPVVVAVSTDLTASTVEGMLRAGVDGYLGKGRLNGSLPDLLERCVEGQVVLAVPSGAAALRQLIRGAAARSPREG